MNTQIRAATLAAILFFPAGLRAQGTAFTYDGRLSDNGSPANGIYDLRFTLYDDRTNNVVVGGPNTVQSAVSNGLFNVQLNFGGVFDGRPRWLEIAVRLTGSANNFVTLDPRLQITPTPYAIYAGRAMMLDGTLPASQLAGTYTSALTFNNSANNFSGTGTGLTALSASQLTGGTVPLAALGNAWKITGNLGTTAATHFLGTTDAQPLEFRVNNTRALRLEPVANTVNVIGGWSANFAASGILGATISGGGTADLFGQAKTNRVLADFGTIGGGVGNTASGGTIGGGYDNFTLGSFATVSGGSRNAATNAGTVGGGQGNRALAGGTGHATVSGGRDNAATASDSFVGGGELNQAGGTSSTVGGGQENKAFGTASTIGGGWRNTTQTNSDDSTIGGGRGNVVDDEETTVAGGVDNTASALGASVAGGRDNSAAESYSAVGGGFANTIEGPYSAISGGQNNSAVGSWATIAGGQANRADNAYAAVGGGLGNTNVGAYSVIPGGRANRAVGSYALAAGRRGKANHSGAFVWADSQDQDFASTAANQFLVRASGGVGIGTTTPRSPLDVPGGISWAAAAVLGTDQGGSIELGNSSAGTSVPYIDFHFGVSAPQDYNIRVINDANGQLTVIGNLVVTGTISPPSDRNVKENFTPIDSREVLGKVASLPMATWNYKSDPSSARHLGPVAQDFRAAFGLGSDDKHIATVDADGVALAAIQGLNAKVEQELQRLCEGLTRQETENAELRRTVSELQRSVRALTEELEGN